MPDGPIGFYTVPTPAGKPKPPDWKSYFTGYIFWGLVVLGVPAFLSWLLVG